MSLLYIVMIIYYLSKSDKKNKKYYVLLFNFKNRHWGKKIYFGDKRYEDYTTHKDIERKYRYIKRHNKRENWNNPLTAGFWSRWILWNKPTIYESMRDIENKFNIKSI